MTLTWRVQGVGNLDQLTLPDPPVPATWRVFANPPTLASSESSLGIAEKTFTWTLIPDQPGQYTIPELDFPYFDPQAAGTAAGTVL